MPKNLFKLQRASNITCIDYLNSLEENELVDLQNIVACDYFNTDQSIVHLLNELIEKVIQKANFDDEMQLVVYEIIFKDKIEKQKLNPLQKRKLYDKLSILARLIENYFVSEGIKEQKAYYDDLLLKRLKEKNLRNIFQRKISRNKKVLADKPVKNTDYHYHNFIGYLHILDYQFEEGMFYENKDYKIDDLNYHLDIFYILHKLKINISILTLEKITEKKFDVSAFSATNTLTELPKYSNHSSIFIYKTAIILLKDQSKKAYNVLSEMLDKNDSFLLKDEIIGLYDLLAHFCVEQIRKGIFKHKDLFTLFKKMDKQDLIASNQFSLIMKLKNMVAVACKVNEFNWAKNVVEKYTTHIREEFRISVYHLNLGVIDYYQKNYKNALSHCIQVDTINTIYDKSCRILILKCHYELDEDYDYRTERIIRSAEKYFKSIKSFNKTEKQLYANFMNIFINLYKIKHNAGKITLAVIKQRLKAQEVNSDKHWLLAKIEELELKK